MIVALFAALLIQAAAPSNDFSQDAMVYDPALPMLDGETTVGLVTPFHTCATPLVAEYVGSSSGQRTEQSNVAFMVSVFEVCPTAEILELAYQAHRRNHPELTEQQARQAAAQSVSLALLGPILSRIVERSSVVEPPIPPCRYPDGSIGPCPRQ